MAAASSAEPLFGSPGGGAQVAEYTARMGFMLAGRGAAREAFAAPPAWLPAGGGVGAAPAGSDAAEPAPSTDAGLSAKFLPGGGGLGSGQTTGDPGIRVRWDDRTNPYEPCLEAVPPAPGEPTWQTAGDLGMLGEAVASGGHEASDQGKGGPTAVEPDVPGGPSAGPSASSAESGQEASLEAALVAAGEPTGGLAPTPVGPPARLAAPELPAAGPSTSQAAADSGTKAEPARSVAAAAGAQAPSAAASSAADGAAGPAPDAALTAASATPPYTAPAQYWSGSAHAGGKAGRLGLRGGLGGRGGLMGLRREDPLEAATARDPLLGVILGGVSKVSFSTMHGLYVSCCCS
jgi:hypothetical protein